MTEDGVIGINEVVSMAASLLGRDTVKQEVENLYADGRVKKAERKAREFNKLVDDRMASFYTEHGDMADELAEDINPQLHISLEVEK